MPGFPQSKEQHAAFEFVFMACQIPTQQAIKKRYRNIKYSPAAFLLYRSSVGLVLHCIL